MKGTLWALSSYDQLHGELPAATHRDVLGRPVSSWRFSLLALLGRGDPDPNSPLPWCDSVRYQIASEPLVYFCFSGKTGETLLDTNVVAVTGPGTAFDGRTRSLKELDGDTILIVELANSGIHWMEPGDLDIQRIPQTITTGTVGDSFHVGFADGDVWRLDASVPLAELRKFFTIDEARQWDRQAVLGPYRR